MRMWNSKISTDDLYKVILNNHGFYSINPLPSEKDLEEYYEKLYWQIPQRPHTENYSKEEERHRLQRNKIVMKLYANLSSETRVLDVGCGEGFFLQQLLDLQVKAEGIDFNDYGISKYNPRALPYFTKGNIYKILNQLEIEAKKYDLIILNNILEHALNPERLLFAVKKLFAANARIIISVPNDFSTIQKELVGRNFTKKMYWVNYPDHLHYLSKNSLEALLTNCGYFAEKTIADFPVEFFIANEYSNYVDYPERGKAAHNARCFLETFINEGDDINTVVTFWESLANLGLGRVITGIFGLSQNAQIQSFTHSPKT